MCNTFQGFLEVFVSVIIHIKSNRNNSFIIVFTCSRAFQRYQTWYVYDHLNLISCQAGQKKSVVCTVQLPGASLTPAWPEHCQLITEEQNEPLRPITGLKICGKHSNVIGNDDSQVTYRALGSRRSQKYIHQQKENYLK